MRGYQLKADKMKKTLLVTIDFWPKVGGVANYYLNLCRNFKLNKIVVLTTKIEREPEDKKLKNNFNFEIYRKGLLTKLPIWPKWLPMFWHIWKVASKEKIKLIWVGDILPTGTVVYYLSKIFKLSYIVSCHGNDLLFAKKVPRKKKMAAKILTSAKYVSANSDYTKKIVQSFGVKEDKIKIVNPGIAVKRASDSADLKVKYGLRDKKVLLSIGRLVERKGFDKVIESLPSVWRKLPELVYVLIGRGEDEGRLKKLARGEERIIFINKEISEFDKWRWLSIADVFIMPSRASSNDVEGFGIVYLEANILGKPVIAGRAGGAQEAVKDGVSGILVNPEDINDIKNAILKIFQDDKLREMISTRARQRAEEEFNWQVILEKFRELLK